MQIQIYMLMFFFSIQKGNLQHTLLLFAFNNTPWSYSHIYKGLPFLIFITHVILPVLYSIPLYGEPQLSNQSPVNGHLSLPLGLLS